MGVDAVDEGVDVFGPGSAAQCGVGVVEEGERREGALGVGGCGRGEGHPCSYCVCCADPETP
jgi:hypothetical protein